MKTEIKYLLNSYKLLYNWKIENNCFIISTGRTATNFFAHFFKENFNNVLSLHEPVPDLFDVAMNKFRHKNVLPTKLLLKLSRYNQHKTLVNNSLDTYIESNPNLSFLIKEIQDIFPNPKFLFLTRDLPSYLISAFNKSPDNSNEMFFYAVNDHRKRITPFDLYDKKYEDLWSSFSREEKIAWYWQATNNFIINQLDGVDYMQIKYEDVFLNENNEGILIDIIHFFNLNISENNFNNFKPRLNKKRNTNSMKIISSFENIDENKRSRIIEITKETREKLNYA